jgi:hypothetical protein
MGLLLLAQLPRSLGGMSLAAKYQPQARRGLHCYKCHAAPEPARGTGNFVRTDEPNQIAQLPSSMKVGRNSSARTSRASSRQSAAHLQPTPLAGILLGGPVGVKELVELMVQHRAGAGRLIEIGFLD